MTAYYRPSQKQLEEAEKDAEDEKVKGYKIHPVVLKKWKEHGYILTNWLPSASQENEKTFWETVEKNGGKPVIREITQIYRIKTGTGNKEYFFYNETLRSENKLGAPIHCSHIVGRYEDPTFRPTFNLDAGQVIGSDVDSVKTVYDLEWRKDFTDKLEEQVIDNASFIVISTTRRKYGGFDFEDFKNRTYDELIMLGKYGTLSPIMKDEIEKIQTKRKLQKIN